MYIFILKIFDNINPVSVMEYVISIDWDDIDLFTAYIFMYYSTFLPKELLPTKPILISGEKFCGEKFCGEKVCGEKVCGEKVLQP